MMSEIHRRLIRKPAFSRFDKQPHFVERKNIAI